MDFDFEDEHLEEVYFDPTVTLGLGPAVDKGFRKVVGFIAQAFDERDLYAYQGFHYHKLKGNRKGQHALDLTDRYRLIVRRVQMKNKIKLLLLTVEDYH